MCTKKKMSLILKGLKTVFLLAKVVKTLVVLYDTKMRHFETLS